MKVICRECGETFIDRKVNDKCPKCKGRLIEDKLTDLDNDEHPIDRRYIDILFR